MLLRMGPLLHLGPVITLVPSTRVTEIKRPGRFLEYMPQCGSICQTEVDRRTMLDARTTWPKRKSEYRHF